MREHALLARGERQRQRLDDLPGEIVLELKDIVQRHLRRLRPEQPAALRLDELRGHAHLRAGAEQRARHRRIDVQLGRERRQIRVRRP